MWDSIAIRFQQMSTRFLPRLFDHPYIRVKYLNKPLYLGMGGGCQGWNVKKFGFLRFEIFKIREHFNTHFPISPLLHSPPFARMSMPMQNF